MRTRHSNPTNPARNRSAKALVFGAGVLLATTGLASAAGAAPKAPVGAIDDLVVVTSTTRRPTTTTTRRITTPTRDLCRIAPELCPPPKPHPQPCVTVPEPKKEAQPELRRQSGPEDLTVRTLTTRTLGTKPTTTVTTPPRHCPPPTTKPQPPVEPPVRVRPSFTG